MRPRTTTTTTTALSDGVKKLREACGVTQEEFASALGVTITTVARWETFRSPTGVEDLLKMRTLAAHHKLENLDDLFYSALLQESLAHRFGYAANLAEKLLVLRKTAVGLAATDEKTKRPLLEMADELTEVVRLVGMLQPPETCADKLAKTLVPDILAGHLPTAWMTGKERRSAAKAVAKMLKPDGKKAKGKKKKAAAYS